MLMAGDVRAMVSAKFRSVQVCGDSGIENVMGKPYPTSFPVPCSQSQNDFLEFVSDGILIHLARSNHIAAFNSDLRT